MSKHKILIVEDEAIVSESLHDQLEKLGYEVVDQVASGEEAIQQTRRLKPDLVLMDIMLEGELDGIEASEKILSRHSLPIIYLTAYSDESTLQRAKITEPFGYIIKPFKERELHTTIEIALHKHHLEQTIKESEEWLATVLRSIGDAVIATDTEGMITFVSPVMEQLTGWSEEDLKGTTLSESLSVSSEEIASLFKSLLQKALEGESTTCLVNQELSLPCKSGEHVPVDLGVAPILGDRQKIKGMVWAVRDIRKRKEAEEMLTETQTLLSNMLTPREKQILQMMVDGSSTKEIAFDLDISARTVEAHRQNMMEKLSTHDMSSLIKLAITHKLAKVR